eukprot:7223829-Ditylum_brightwellii.AAC.1
MAATREENSAQSPGRNCAWCGWWWNGGVILWASMLGCVVAGGSVWGTSMVLVLFVLCWRGVQPMKEQQSWGGQAGDSRGDSPISSWALARGLVSCLVGLDPVSSSDRMLNGLFERFAGCGSLWSRQGGRQMMAVAADWVRHWWVRWCGGWVSPGFGSGGQGVVNLVATQALVVSLGVCLGVG